MELKREQIIKALECCTNCICIHAETDTECPLVKMSFCKNYLMKQSLSLINELTEEVERVTKQCGEIIVECDVRETERLKQVAELTQAHEMLSESYDHLEKTKDELLAERSRLNVENERLRAEGEWISVDDRLPEPYTTVLVYGMGSIASDYLTSRGVWYNHEIITHWKHLPEPPKMKGE